MRICSVVLLLCVAASSVAHGNVTSRAGLPQLKRCFNTFVSMLPAFQQALDEGTVAVSWEQGGDSIDWYIAQLEPQQYRELLDDGYRILAEDRDEISFVDIENSVLALQVLSYDKVMPALAKPDQGLASEERHQKALEHAEKLGHSAVAELLREHAPRM